MNQSVPRTLVHQAVLKACSLMFFACYAWSLPSHAAPTQPQAQAQATQDSVAQTPNSTPANPHDPNAPTLMQAHAPSFDELSRANEELLAKNAELSRQVSSLTTQTNVLVSERSGQLFMYGALVAGVSFFVGLMLGRLLFRRDRW